MNDLGSGLTSNDLIKEYSKLAINNTEAHDTNHTLKTIDQDHDQPVHSHGLVYKIFHLGDHVDEETHTLFGYKIPFPISGSVYEKDSEQTEFQRKPSIKGMLNRKQSNSKKRLFSGFFSKSSGDILNIPENQLLTNAPLSNSHSSLLLHTQPNGKISSPIGSPNLGHSRQNSQNIHSEYSPTSGGHSRTPSNLSQNHFEQSLSPTQSPIQEQISNPDLSSPPSLLTSPKEWNALSVSLSTKDLFSMFNEPKSRTNSEASFNEKYHRSNSILGKGTYATVKLCSPIGSDVKFAVKEYRKKDKHETNKEYIKKINAEFCIASTLVHENIVKSFEMIQDSKQVWCVVMEYCEGGDLYQRITNGSLVNEAERLCYFKQLCHGVEYIHSRGVAHRDLKPENLMLDKSGRILKISDFGVSAVFKDPFGTLSKKLSGITGSCPYIAPEEYTCKEYVGELVDIWAVGIIGYAMNANSIPWSVANDSDSRFITFKESRQHFSPFERLHPKFRNLMYKMLEIQPDLRLTMEKVLNDEWIKSIEYCHGNETEMERMLHLHESHSNRIC